MRRVWVWRSKPQEEQEGVRDAGRAPGRTPPPSKLLASSAHEDRYALLFSRSFVTVEEKAKALLGSKYQGVPAHATVLAAFLNADIPQVNGAQDADWYDDDSKQIGQRHAPPLYTIDHLWPCVVIQKGDYIAAFAPLCSASAPLAAAATTARDLACAVDSDQEPPSTSSSVANIILQDTSISSGLLFLEEILSVASVLSTHDESVVMGNLGSYVAFACPMGSYNGLSYKSVAKLIAGNQEHFEAKKMPAWRVGSFDDAPSVQFFITERISVTQQFPDDTYDDLIVSGSVDCRFNLPSAPDVSLTVSSSCDLRKCRVSHIVNRNNRGITPNDRQLAFTPPLTTFTLMQYQTKVSASPLEPPLLASYTITNSDCAKKVLFVITLRKSDKLDISSFSDVEVVLPFFNRGAISDFQAKATLGQVAVRDIRANTLVWSIGSSFSSRVDAASLECSVTFDYPYANTDHHHQQRRHGSIQGRWKRPDGARGAANALFDPTKEGVAHGPGEREKDEEDEEEEVNEVKETTGGRERRLLFGGGLLPEFADEAETIASQYEDPFCSGKTAYADISFASEAKLLTNTGIPSESIRINPLPARLASSKSPNQLKNRALSTQRLESLNYRVWCVNGDSRKPVLAKW